MAKTTKFAEIAERFELPAQIARQFARLYERSPAVARELLAELAKVDGITNNGAAPVRRSSPGPGRGTPSNYGTLARMFVETDNARATKAEIAERTGLSENQVHTLLYGAHKGSFHKWPDPKGTRAKAFRLTKAAYEAAKEPDDG